MRDARPLDHSPPPPVTASRRPDELSTGGAGGDWGGGVVAEGAPPPNESCSEESLGRSFLGLACRAEGCIQLVEGRSSHATRSVSEVSMGDADQTGSLPPRIDAGELLPSSRIPAAEERSGLGSLPCTSWGSICAQ